MPLIKRQGSLRGQKTMRLRTKVIGFLVAVLGCTALLQRCNKPSTVKGPAQLTTSGGDGDTIVISQPGKAPIKIYQPDPKSTVITTDKNGNVTVKVRQFGVGFEPGIGLGYSTKTRFALDARLVYYKRFGFNMGLGLATDPESYGVHKPVLSMVTPYAGISYVPWLRFSNTSIVASYTLDNHVYGFARWRF